MSCPQCEKIKKSTKQSDSAALKNEAARDRLFLLISLVALIAGFLMAQSEIHFPGFPLTDPSWLAVILCGFPIFREAGRALFETKKITSSLLISTAITAAIALQLFVCFGGNADVSEGGAHAHDSYIFAAGEIAFLMALGEMIEMWTVKKSRKGIEALIELSPKKAERKTADGSSETVPVEELAPGDLVFAHPDEMIPADGVVVEGSGSVNQASLTGESVPVDKARGDSVLAGTWNMAGAMTIRVSKSPEETAIARLIALVREAEEKKAPIQHIADRWAARIVPTAVVCAVLVGLFAYFVLGKDVITALIRAVTILVVFCPCAFALATPTAIAAGVGNMARRGILVKSGEALEKIALTDTAIFDKTGTLTQAKLRVEAVFPCCASAGTAPRFSPDEILALCAAAEKRSRHPIARAIVAEAEKKRLSLPLARNISSRTGVGIACDVDDEEVLACSFSALAKENVCVPAEAQKFANERRSRGETLVCVVSDGDLAGLISLSDTLRDGVPAMMAALKADGVRTVMLSGDNVAAARRIAELSGADAVFADLLPEGKSQKIADLRGSGKRTLMVGDGVNDAPAMARADCSVAMGALGSELAVETADIAILNDNVALVPGLIRFSKAVLKTIHINFGISLFINFSAVVLSVAGVLDPVTGAIVHNASSVLVVSHSALLIFRRFE